MKVVVTGSAGFLGGHITGELLARGHQVVGIDLVHSYLHDLRYVDNVERHFAQHADADWCIHLAAKVGRLFGEDNPMETVVDNVGMAALVAEACGRRGIRLAYASTSEVYGDNGDASCDEEMGPFTRPHNVYGISKFFGEELCDHYVERPLIFRFSMPYGPGLPAGRGRAALINMLHQALHRRPIPVHLGAERSWCWVGDTARAVRMLIEGNRSGAYNVGRDDQAVSMLTVAKRACALVGAPESLIELVDAPGRQTVVKRLATEKLRQLGWRPEVDLLEGMQRTLDWVKSLDPTGAAVAPPGDARSASVRS